MLPFNVELLDLTPDKLRMLTPVTSLDPFDGGTDNFHDEGLFSIPIFGKIGSDERDLRFSYIDIKTTIFHPIIYTRLSRLKGLYKSILSGKTHAVWDAQRKDFMPSTPLEGRTGYAFFIEHWKDIDFKETKSVERQQRIELINKYKNRAMTSTILVLPAGLRDLRISESGRQDEDEINGMYRRVLSIANTIHKRSTDENSPTLDKARHNLQMAFNEIYETIEKMLRGKKGFIQNKWGSRRIFNGTRNVISSMDTSVSELGRPNSPKFDDTVVGLYQTLKSALPLAKHLILTGYLSKVFGGGDARVTLIDKETLKPEYVELSPEVIDRWSTPDGIGKIIDSYLKLEIRLRPIEIEGRYLGLIYIGPDRTFRIFFDIDELPEHLSREHVHPLNLCQLLYLSGYRQWYDLRAFVTRYPVTGVESIYPTSIYVKTTTTGEMRWELDHNWERMGDEYAAYEFPKPGVESHMESMSPHSSRLAGLVADFDGDTCSLDIVYSDEAKAEIDQMLNQRQGFISPKGGLVASADVDTIALVLKNMTGA